jgi:hypothetical protein
LKKKKLTDSEIREAVEKIREEYSEYMTRFGKPRDALDAFEDRYIDALRVRMDLALFLHAEHNVAEQLMTQEHERIEKDKQKQQALSKEKVEKLSATDKIIEEQTQRIGKYPKLFINNDASNEVSRLFGALGAIDREFWADLEKYLRKTYASLYSNPRGRIEEKILQLCRPGTDNIPSRLIRYAHLFSRFPRDYLEIEKEEKRSILDSAFFLFDLLDVLKEVKSGELLSVSEIMAVEKMEAYVNGIIQDFRLKEFKSLNR